MTEFPVRATLDSRNLDHLITLLAKAGKAAGLTEKEISDLNKELKNTSSNGVKGVNDVNQSFDNLAKKGIKLATEQFLKFIAVQQLLRLGKQIIDITSEFQRLHAVLKTTLGSESAAAQAFRRIQDFASKTPFQVREVTQAFVSLANRGFVPTNEELRKLGDLAASQGKSFQQLTEAILDAETLEFERLKEFGIKARQTNDSVIFTFKGVRTEVDKNEESIRKYILSLGDLEGVQGGMDEISKTLGGTLSNAADATDRLFSALGNMNSGPLKETISLFTELTNWLSKYIEFAQRKPFQELYGKETQAEIEKFNKLTRDEQAKAINQTVTEIQRWRGELKQLEDAHKAFIGDGGSIRHLSDAADILNLSLSDTNEIMNDYALELEQTQAILTDYEDRYKQFLKVWDQGTAKIEEQAAAEAIQNQKLREQAAEEALLIQLMKARIEFQKKAAEITRETNEKVQQIKPSLDAEAEVRDAFNKRIKKDRIESEKETNEELRKERERAYDEELKAREEQERRIIELSQQALEFIAGIKNQFAASENIRLRNELDLIEERRDRELEGAANNAEARKRINKKYDDEQKKLQRRQAERDRDLAVFNILLNTARGITAALASVPPNVPLSIFVGITGAIQAGIAETATLPKFAEGVYDFQGKGTDTSDSNLARISRGEDIVPAKRNKKWGFLLEPIINNDHFELKDARELLNDRLQLRQDLFQINPTPAREELAPLLMESNKLLASLEKKKEFHLDIDENGFQKWTVSSMNWTNYVNKRYSS